MNKRLTVTVMGLLLLSIASLGAADDPTAPATEGVTVRIPEQPLQLSSPTTAPMPRASAPSPAPSHSAPATSTPPVAPQNLVVPIAAKGPAINAHPAYLNATSAAPGGTIVATVRGYTPGEKVRFVLYSSPIVIGDALADPSGSATQNVGIPKNLPAGTHTIEATGWESHRVSNQTFLVVTSAKGIASLFPWIIWVIAGGILLLAGLAVAVAFAFVRRSLPMFPTRSAVIIEGSEL
ncbi:MAG: hypothetical protein H7248_09990 [Microbacteriaceae bacterium]|nr:hypothetical protein [Microbacteriaceae bacterium]